MGTEPHPERKKMKKQHNVRDIKSLALFYFDRYTLFLDLPLSIQRKAGECKRYIQRIRQRHMARCREVEKERRHRI